jgi:MvaI/BcnI restriction endonuclease family
VLESTDRPIEPIIAFLAQRGIEAAYIVPTATGLEKSILDAHTGLRDYFRIVGFHDYQKQPQGTAGKRIVQAFFVTPSGFEKAQVSLYRPDTKSGDPRIWMYGLKDRVQSGNLLAILAYESCLYIVNVSNRALLSDEGNMHPNFDSVVQKIADASNVIAMELLNHLKGFANRGWIKSERKGPTGVGYTLESMLGIAANSSKNPDYKGIELKSGRGGGGKSASRSTLFSKVPDWTQGRIQNGLELLDAYGYKVDGRLQLYCSLKNVPNSLGHFLELRKDDAYLHSKHLSSSDKKEVTEVLLWDMDLLRSALATKHRETFWVKAKVKREDNGYESFHYSDVVHTKGPLLGNMVEMFRSGLIELDYTIHEETGIKGGRKSRDHGYLFKMWQKNLPSLFPPPKRYSLI